MSPQKVGFTATITSSKCHFFGTPCSNVKKYELTISNRINFSLSLAVQHNVNTWKPMKLVDINGMEHQITTYEVSIMLTIGWIAFILSYIVNIIFYIIHPSGVDINISRLQNKFMFHIFGKKIDLRKNAEIVAQDEDILLGEITVEKESIADEKKTEVAPSSPFPGNAETLNSNISHLVLSSIFNKIEDFGMIIF